VPVSRDLSIIIVNWHSANFVAQCIKSICQHAPELSFEIVVIDNASRDGCQNIVRQYGDHVIYVQSEKNLGFACANNRAVAASQGAAFLFLNPDTEVTGGAIQHLYNTLYRLPDAGSVGPKLLNADGSIQTSCIQSFPTILNQSLDSEFLRQRTPLWRLWGMAPLYTETNDPTEVEVISGACLMLKRDVFQRVGGFTEDYFMYGEDADLCLKVSKIGLQNYYDPEAVVVHYGGSSSGQAASGFSAMMMRESIWRFFRRWHGERYGNCYRFAMLCAATVRLAFLGMLFVVRELRPRRQRKTDSIIKWWSILIWSTCRNAHVVEPG
jgi:hypothetical protein